MKKAVKAYKNNKIVAQTMTHGLSMASATAFIVWTGTLGGLVIPAGAAAFIAGCMVPIIQYLLNKLDD